ncbi:MAG: hypothetical protein NVSMB47_06700 [Polyangiales bacterium]
MVNGIPPGGGGKIGGPAGSPPASGTERSRGAEGPAFGEALGKTEHADPAHAAHAAHAATPLDRLRSGEIDVQRYAELRVHEATAHLEGVLPPGDLDKLRDDLHDLIEHDPDVAALVQAAQVR